MSTHDVFAGLVEAMRASGAPVAEYRFDGRLSRTHQFLHFLFRKSIREMPDRHWPKPTNDDVLLTASMDLVPRAWLLKCDAILIVTGMFLPPDIIELAKRTMRVYLLCTESPYDSQYERHIAQFADAVWVTERSVVESFREVCPQVAYLRHAWRPGVHDVSLPTDRQQPAHDVVFVGSYFEERVRLLEQVDWTGIDLGLYGMLDMIPKRSPLRRFAKNGVTPNPVAAALYRRAKIGLNLYRTSATAQSLNPRAYELAASGVCSVSEHRDEIADVFGDAVPTFHTPAELEAHVRALLADEPRRSSLAAAAKSVVLDDIWPSRVDQMRRDLHTWAARSAPSLSRSA